jgi:uncharacterized Fe-S radical SAM superfamily protein PflX
MINHIRDCQRNILEYVYKINVNVQVMFKYYRPNNILYLFIHIYSSRNNGPVSSVLQTLPHSASYILYNLYIIYLLVTH